LSPILTQHRAEQGTPNIGQGYFRLRQEVKPDQGFIFNHCFHSYCSASTQKVLSDLAVVSWRCGPWGRLCAPLAYRVDNRATSLCVCNPYHTIKTKNLCFVLTDSVHFILWL